MLNTQGKRKKPIVENYGITNDSTETYPSGDEKIVNLDTKDLNKSKPVENINLDSHTPNLKGGFGQKLSHTHTNNFYEHNNDNSDKSIDMNINIDIPNNSINTKINPSRVEWNNTSNQYEIYTHNILECTIKHEQILKSIINADHDDPCVKKYFFITKWIQSDQVFQFNFIDSLFVSDLDTMIRVQNFIYDTLKNFQNLSIDDPYNYYDTILLFYFQFIIYTFSNTDKFIYTNTETNIKISKFYSNLVYRYSSLVLKKILGLKSTLDKNSFDLQHLIKSQNELVEQLDGLTKSKVKTDGYESDNDFTDTDTDTDTNTNINDNRENNKTIPKTKTFSKKSINDIFSDEAPVSDKSANSTNSTNSDKSNPSVKTNSYKEINISNNEHMLSDIDPIDDYKKDDVQNEPIEQEHTNTSISSITDDKTDTWEPSYNPSSAVKNSKKIIQKVP